MIKYSDCSNGYKYGADGKQLSNWNPDKDYGEEYAKVYFRIDTPIYQYPLSCAELAFRMRMNSIRLQKICSKNSTFRAWMHPHSEMSLLKYLKNTVIPVSLRAVMNSKKEEKKDEIK